MHGDQLASASKDHVARLWGLRSLGTCFAEWVHPEWVGACDFSPDSSLLATGADDSRVRLWQTDPKAYSQAPVVLRGASAAWIAGVGFASTHLLLSVSRDGELSLWDTRSHALLATEWERPVRQPGARSSVLISSVDVCGAIAVVSRTLSSASVDAGDHALLVYDLAGGALRRTHTLRDENRPVGCVALDRSHSAVATQSSMLASGGIGGTVRLWDLRSGQSVSRLENACSGCIRSVALSGHLLVAGREPGPLINVWDLRASRIVQRLRGHANNDALTMDAQRGRLACGGRMNELRVWQVDV